MLRDLAIKVIGTRVVKEMRTRWVDLLLLCPFRCLKTACEKTLVMSVAKYRDPEVVIDILLLLISLSRYEVGINADYDALQRPRVEQVKPAVPEVPPVSPSLVPALPTPIPPTKDTGSAPEAMGFFERVKKYLADKKVFNEFLKLCNLFTQGFIDKNILMHRVHNFIGGNNDIMNYFRDFIQYDGRDEVIENKPRVPGDKVVLSNCRGLGPSYRMLPKRERLRKCSGRDQLCNAVLNDEWVSHPTWASEDSGFIAHRKNTHEESLHRIEEERHDYDINIEACQRTIQLIEPIVQQLQIMTDAERRAYRLPPGIGGQSETIYQRVIKKIYGREQGQMVINEMFDRPSPVLLTLLARLRQKAEEWKAGQVRHSNSCIFFDRRQLILMTARMGEGLA